MVEVRKIAATIPISDEMFETNPLFVRIEKAYADMYADMWREMEMTRLHGPLLGPGRNELWRIEAPARRRRQIRANTYAAMPGKRPGSFVRG